MNNSASAQKPIRTTIPARLDHLHWSPFHTRMIIGLGVAWILDGLEITIASSITGVLSQSDTLHLASTEVGLIATVYLVGEVVGSLVFGRLSDKLGRRTLFMVTLGVYLIGSGLSALTFGVGLGWIIYFYATRFVAGLGIGGEYAAINSAIDEMMPARYRGHVDIGINGTYWAGSILGTFASLVRSVFQYCPDCRGDWLSGVWIAHRKRIEPHGTLYWIFDRGGHHDPGRRHRGAVRDQS
jgi:MFS family permease